MTRRPRWHTPLILGLAGAVWLVAAARAELPAWLLPGGHPQPVMWAGPRDPATRSQVVYDSDGITQYGSGMTGEVSMSESIAILGLPGPGEDDAVIVGIEAAAFARFAFQVGSHELVNTDWIFTVPVTWRRHQTWIRLRYYHTSSHLGDEYQRRFQPESFNFSRDGIDLTVQGGSRAGIAAYGVVFWSANAHPRDRPRWELRTGLELDPCHGALWQPLAAVDVHLEEATDWDPRLTAQAGIWLPRVEDRRLRLVLQAMVGPSLMGQFRLTSATTLGLGIVLDP